MRVLRVQVTAASALRRFRRTLSAASADARPRTPLNVEERLRRLPEDVVERLASLPPVPAHYAKRTVALCVAYDGSPYKGNTSTPALPRGSTVDDVLEDALLLAGMLEPLNYRSPGLSRAKWSRSSRTDKGVSSLATWVTCRIEVDPAWWPTAESEGEELLSRLEQHLPASVSVLAAPLVPRRFEARDGCMTRSYSFLLPLRAVTHPFPAADGELLQERIALLSAALQEFEGTHPFHCYTKRALYRPTQKQRGAPAEEDGGAEEEEEAALPISAPAGPSSSHVSGNVAEGCFWYVLPPERNDPDTIGNQHFRLVIAARCAPAPELVDGQPAVRITVVGESFLIHQIRKMTGTALAVALGHLPLSFIRASLCKPARTRVPMLPASTLQLCGASFRPFRPDTSGGAPDPSAPERRLAPSSLAKRRAAEFEAERLYPALGAALADASWDELLTDNLPAMCAQPPDVQALCAHADAWLEAAAESARPPGAYARRA